MTTTNEMTIAELKSLKAEAETKILRIIQGFEDTVSQQVLMVEMTRNYIDPDTVKTAGVSLRVMI